MLHVTAPCVRNHHVEASKLALGPQHGVFDGGGVGHIERKAERRAPTRRDLPRERLELGSATSGKRDLRAARRVLERQSTPNAARGAGDEEGSRSHGQKN